MTQQGIAWRLARIPGYDGTAHRHMASAVHWADFTGADNVVQLRPDWGHAASYYQLRVGPMQEVEPGWYAFRTLLTIDGCDITEAFLPASIYLGALTEEGPAHLSDAASCLVRFAERQGPGDPHALPNAPGYVAPGSWLLTGMRVG